MKIAVITINLNNAAGLAKTIQSVIAQSYRPAEYIVVDGASVDDSVAVIQRFSDHIHHWISEPDGGVYEAQNKGLALTEADYVLFLNSGDCFVDKLSLEKLVAGISTKNQLVYGDILVENEDGSTWLKQYPDILPADYFNYESLPHPATLIPVFLLKKMGGYDTRFNICADWKFFRYVWLHKKVKPVHVSEPVSIFAAGGMSSNPAHQAMISKEKQAIGLMDRYRPGIPERLRSKLRKLL